MLPRTGGWACKSTRSAELGEFELAAAPAQITISHVADPAVDLYALRLVRLPPAAPADPLSGVDKDTSFRDFNTGAGSYEFTADLKRDGFILVNEIYYPGWEATVDGKPTEILPADYTFRALAMSAGSHRIVMRFRPPYFWFGGLISLLTLAALFGYLLLHRRGQH